MVEVGVRGPRRIGCILPLGERLADRAAAVARSRWRIG